MNKFLLFSFLFLSFFKLSFARGPAVDPVRGISIEEYQEVKPEDAKGFNFDRKTGRIPAMNNKNLSAGDEKEISIYMVFLILLSLHLGAWFFISNKIKSEKKKVPIKDENNDDFNLPKAS